jgi:hypothetical protein
MAQNISGWYFNNRYQYSKVKFSLEQAMKAQRGSKV